MAASGAGSPSQYYLKRACVGATGMEPSIGWVGILPALEPRQVLRSHFVLCAGCRQVGQRGHERQPALDAILLGRANAPGMIEAAQRNRDPIPPEVTEGEGGAAIAAE